MPQTNSDLYYHMELLFYTNRGDVESAQELLKVISQTLKKEGKLPPVLEEHLIRCLDGIVKGEDPAKALKLTRQPGNQPRNRKESLAIDEWDTLLAKFDHPFWNKSSMQKRGKKALNKNDKVETILASHARLSGGYYEDYEPEYENYVDEDGNIRRVEGDPPEEAESEEIEIKEIAFPDALIGLSVGQVNNLQSKRKQEIQEIHQLMKPYLS